MLWWKADNIAAFAPNNLGNLFSALLLWLQARLQLLFDTWLSEMKPKAMRQLMMTCFSERPTNLWAAG